MTGWHVPGSSRPVNLFSLIQYLSGSLTIYINRIHPRSIALEQLHGIYLPSASSEMHSCQLASNETSRSRPDHSVSSGNRSFTSAPWPISKRIASQSHLSAAKYSDLDATPAPTASEALQYRPSEQEENTDSSNFSLPPVHQRSSNPRHA